MSKIFIDIDGVIRDIETPVFGSPAKEWGLKIGGLDFVEYIDQDIARFLLNAKGAFYFKPLRNWITKYGSSSIVFLSYQPPNWIPYTRQWLKKYFPSVKYIFTKRAEEKLAIVRKNSGWLIDDYPLFSNYDRVIVIDKKYNRKVRGLKRIKTQKEFYQTLKFLSNGTKI